MVPASDHGTPGPTTVQRLLPPGPRVAISDFARELDLAGCAGERRREHDAAHSDPRPYLVLNMIASADGRATLAGRTASLGNWADRELFHALRAEADAVMAGAGTVRQERYGRTVRDPDVRAQRRARGRTEEPLAVVVSDSLALPADLPLLAEPEAHVVVVTASDGTLSGCAAQVDYVRKRSGAPEALGPALAELRERFGVAVLLCEGGPRLNSDLLAAGLVDELFLSVAPLLGGGDDELRIVHGPPLEPPLGMRLVSLLESESHLFARYALVHAA